MGSILPFVDLPALPAVVAGRSALPAFLAIEAHIQERLQGADAAAVRRVQEAEEEAASIRTRGETALREAVLAGEREAMREVEDRARDRVSTARRSVQRWVDEAEHAALEAVEEAVTLLTSGGEGV